LTLSVAIITDLILEKIWRQEENAQLFSLNIEYQNISLDLKKDLIEWLKNIWDFIKKIHPLVLLGIFIIGIVKMLINY
jgi:uncharacterized membrane protein YraQ (UPF0718 family)